jgi:hypothetical protein
MGFFLALCAFHLVQDLVSLVDPGADLLLPGKLAASSGLLARGIVTRIHWPKPRAGSVSRAAAKRQRAVEPGAANAARARLAVKFVRWMTAGSRGG